MVPFFLNSNSAFSGEFFERSDLFFSKIFNNAGNSYITYSMVRQLGGDQASLTAKNSLASLHHAPVSADEAARINREFTHIFFTLQDHLREDFDDSFYEHAILTLQRLHLPVIAYSLGANSMSGYDPALHRKLSPVKKQFFALLSQRCATIGIRGDYTASVLEKLGIKNYAIIGCPTYFERGFARHITKKPWDDHSLVGATGNYTHAESQRLYYLLQDELIISKLLYFSDPLRAEDGRHFSSPMLRNARYVDSIKQSIARGQVSLYADMDVWRELISTKLHFVIGSRLHGAIMALNAGVPAILTNGDARASETAAFLKIPHYPGGTGLPKRLREIYDHADHEVINRHYTELYYNFKGWMDANGIQGKPLTKTVSTEAYAPAMLQPCSVSEQHLRLQQFDALLASYRWRAASMADYARRIARRLAVEAASILFGMPTSSATQKSRITRRLVPALATAIALLVTP